MNGIERLEEQTLKINNPNVTGIFNYLKTRKDLEKYFENEEKSMVKMYEYVTEKAKERAYKMVSIIEDNLVYLWATNYFMKSNEKQLQKVPITLRNFTTNSCYWVYMIPII